MYYADLTEYSYVPSYARPGLLNVGWLDGAHEYPVKIPSGEFVEALWRLCHHGVAVMRGFHACESCDPQADELTVATLHGVSLHLGFFEIRAFSGTGQAFAAPSLVFHYVVAHHYAPPAKFVDAVVNGLQPGTSEYARLLEHHSEAEDLFRKKLGP